MKKVYFISFAKRYIGVLIAAVLLPFGLYAQAPTLKVVAPNVVALGERFQLIFETDISDFSNANFTAPTEFENVNLIAGPYTSTMRSSTFINGKSSETIRSQITYLAVPEKEGKIVIGKAALETPDGKVYHSAVKEIEVVNESAGARQPAGGGSSQHRGSAQSPTASAEDNLFIRVNVSKANLYKGDNFIVTIKLYVRNMNLQGFEGFKPPTFNGFYSQELDAPSQLVFQQENVNNRIFNVAVLRRYILYPQQVGSLKIDPSELSVIAVLPSARSRSPFDDFFAPQGEVVRKKLVSPQLTINVKELPSGAPASFSGAVGDFKLETSLSKTDVVANNAIAHVTKITGTGNFKLFTTPKISFPTDFEVYEPKTTDNLRNSNSGLTGSRSTEITLIPRSAGTYTIPPAQFTYFDPDAGKYITISSKEFTVTVARDSVSSGSAVTPVSRQQDIRYIGEDIRSNNFAPQSWTFIGSSFFCSMTYYSLYILVIVVFIVAVFILKERARRKKNVIQAKNRRANGVAKKRLSTAGKYLKSGDVSHFYEELLKASWGYLSDKFNLPVASLSRDNVREVLSNKEVDIEDIDAFITVVDECEFARYAPGTGHTQMENVYNDAIGVISRLEQKIR